MNKIEQAVGFDRDEYEELKRGALADGIQILHLRRYSGYEEGIRNGGATVAWRRVDGNPRSKMVEVAVAWCNPKDTFCRRIGSWLALSLFSAENTILMPVGNEDNSEVVSNLRAIFGELV